jgi:hypothetical protein
VRAVESASRNPTDLHTQRFRAAAAPPARVASVPRDDPHH